MLRQEAQCKLDLPMCFEKDDWEPGAAGLRRFTCVNATRILVPGVKVLIWCPLQMVESRRLCSAERAATHVGHLAWRRRRRDGPH